MTAFNEVVKYLTDKVRATSPTHPRANTGAQFLVNYPHFEEDAEILVDKAIRAVQLMFRKETSDDPAGTAKLTNTSMVIGRVIGNHVDCRPLPVPTQLRLGDLFIEAMYNCELINIYYTRTYSDAHTLTPTTKWQQLGEIDERSVRANLYATVFEKPKPITNCSQRVKDMDYNVIKERYDKFDINQPWVRAADKLQQTGWRINQRVYDTVHDNKDLFVSDEVFEDNDSKEQKRLSKQLEWSYLLTKAKKLYDEDVFYQYVDLDYRGRIYYIESFFNFQGTDLARGIMEFAQAKPMTDSGLQWLAIHTASVFNMSYDIDEIPDWCDADYKTHLEREDLQSISVDKMTLHDRIEWTNQHMDTICEAGKHLQISEKADKAVSFLAACVEWHDYHEAHAQNRMHMTRLPIPIDGANNGWQHLGAISKDEHTGKLVGLTPVDIPQDFYVKTAKVLIDLNQDDEITELLDSMPMKHIRKGVSKRGSMTRAYSAGAKKISENMYFDCETEDFHESYGITPEHCDKLAKLLVRAVDQVCPGPLQTMGYLQKLAGYKIGRYTRNIERSRLDELRQRRRELFFNKDRTDDEDIELNDIVVELEENAPVLVYGQGATTIEWTTPSGFDVLYEKWTMNKIKVRGTISGYTDNNDAGRVNHVVQEASDLPDIQGFMCGISPNYIHSLDASHMAMVIDEWNGDFGAVHDSFSTHAPDVSRLLQITKNIFINMYDHHNYFDVIRQEITNSEDDIEQPTQGNLNIGDINASTYFFA